MRKHIDRHDEVQNKVKCPSCDKFFTRHSNLSVHFENIHPNDDENALQFVEMVPRTRQNTGLHKCSECPSAFSRKSHLESHLASEHKIGKSRRVVCDSCNASFANQSSLNRHIRKRHETSKLCHECGGVGEDHREDCELAPEAQSEDLETEAEDEFVESVDEGQLCDFCGTFDEIHFGDCPNAIGNIKFRIIHFIENDEINLFNFR